MIERERKERERDTYKWRAERGGDRGEKDGGSRGGGKRVIDGSTSLDPS